MKKYLRKIIYFYWKISGVDIIDYETSFSMDEKRQHIKDVQSHTQIKIFIESGTLFGDTIDFLKNSFHKLISIELSRQYYLSALSRFKGDPSIEIINGDSGEKIKEILHNINEKCFFWLDGHYSSGNTAKGNKETPIFEELSAILNHRKDHVILIDDARLFLGKNDYPWLPKLKKFVDKLTNRSYKIRLEKDIIMLLPKS